MGSSHGPQADRVAAVPPQSPPSLQGPTSALPILAASCSGVRPSLLRMVSSSQLPLLSRIMSYMRLTKSFWVLKSSATVTSACRMLFPRESWEVISVCSFSISNCTISGWLVHAAKARGVSPGERGVRAQSFLGQKQHPSDPRTRVPDTAHHSSTDP